MKCWLIRARFSNSLIMSALWFLLFAFGVEAKPDQFSMVDRICAVVGEEPPILASDIQKRSQQRNISYKEALDGLIGQEALWVFAKKQLKIDLGQINKAAQDHVEHVLAERKLTQAQFIEILMRPPYSMTLSQFLYETKTAILEQQLIPTLAAQVVVTDEKVHQELAKKFDIVFVTVAQASQSQKKSEKNALNSQFYILNEIKTKILNQEPLAEIKRQYKGNKNIEILGPYAYEKDTFNKDYEAQLEKSSHQVVTDIFKEGDSLTMIWKIPAVSENLDKTALEKVRKELYDRAVMEKYRAVTDAMIDDSTVVINNCNER
jgi:hypothetical protein